MKNKIPNAAEVWKQMEDVLVPQLRLSILDRSVYSHLLRHSRLEGKLRLRFSIQWLARAVRVSGGPAREAVRRLAALGALRLIERTKIGHLVEVRLPGEISAKSRPGRRTTSIGRNSGAPDMPAPAFPSDDTDFLQTRALRQSIHSRERGLCFYCLRRLSPSQKCLDHVVPRVQFGLNSYRNLVSCCVECNSQKSGRPARDYLRNLYRDQRLTSAELTDRLRALKALFAGKLPPPTASGAPPAPVYPACPEPRREPRRVPSTSRRSRIPAPPGGPANPFPHKGRPPGSRRLPQIS